MKKTENIESSKTRLIHKTNTVLFIIIGVIVLLLFTGTVAGLVRNKDTPLITMGTKGSAQTQQESFLTDDIRVFSGIGRLRIPLANSSVLILSIAFPYQDNDIAFKEELAGKINEFKNIAQDYFTSLPENEIVQINEEAAKTEILNRYNSILRLGRIPVLYFNDLLIIDAY